MSSPVVRVALPVMMETLGRRVTRALLGPLGLQDARVEAGPWEQVAFGAGRERQAQTAALASPEAWAELVAWDMKASKGLLARPGRVVYLAQLVRLAPMARTGRLVLPGVTAPGALPVPLGPRARRVRLAPTVPMAPMEQRAWWARLAPLANLAGRVVVDVVESTVWALSRLCPFGKMVLGPRATATTGLTRVPL